MWVYRGLICGRGLTPELEFCHKTPAQGTIQGNLRILSDS